MTLAQKIMLLAILATIFCSIVWVLRPVGQPINLSREVLLRQECQARLMKLAVACKKFKEQSGSWPFEIGRDGSKVLSWRDQLLKFIDDSTNASEISQALAFRCDKCDSAVELSYFPVVMPDGEFALICGTPQSPQLTGPPLALQAFVNCSRPIHTAGFILLRLSGNEEVRCSTGETMSALTGVEWAE